jgi:hypothetical protein
LVPASSTKIYVQKTCAGYDTLAALCNDHHSQDPQSFEGFQLQERAAEQSATRPYVPLTDLPTTKESSDNLKIRLLYGTVFNMTIFTQGSTKEYLDHITTVLRLINQKGLNVLCRNLAKTVDKLAGTLENLQK